jgi:Arc/MetJ family transcription regulator
LFEGLRAEGLSRIAGGRNGAHPVVYPDRVAEDILTPKVVEMAKTLIDVDEETLAAAQEVLGAGTKKDTVNAALRAVVALAARRRDLQRLVAGGLPDLEDAEVMAAAWQR